MTDLIYKQAEVSTSGQGILNAWLSRYGNEDDQMDIMEKGCFADWLMVNGGKPVPILKGHNISEFPLGHWEDFVETDEGLKATGRLALEENPEAQTAAGLIRKGMVSGVSVGFQMLAGVPARRANGRMGRNITKAWLMEASITPFRPANPEAVVEEIDGDEVKNIYKASDPLAFTRKVMADWQAEKEAERALRIALAQRQG